MGRNNTFPVPKKRYHRNTWEIFWNWNYRRYSFNPGRYDQKDPAIEADLRLVASILASPTPSFPKPWNSAPGVQKYLTDRYGSEDDGEGMKVKVQRSEAFTEYRRDLERNCSQQWADGSYRAIQRLDKFIPGGVFKTTPVLARQYLNAILDAGRTPGTRNRNLAACSRFFNWCVNNEMVAANPFSEIGNMPEPENSEIVYCTPDERHRIIVAARHLGRPDWIAVPIALYAGCRRAEIFRIDWADVNLATHRIVIRKSKTGKKRMVPIANDLMTILKQAGQGRGLVVPPIAGTGWANQADSLVEMLRDQLSMPKEPDLTGRAYGAFGTKSYLDTESEIQKFLIRKAEMASKLKKISKETDKAHNLALELACLEAIPDHAYDGQPWLPAERIRWNAWRHTFATLRAQAGVSLDKICSWMGNSYDVCKKHYAEFMPRGEYDADIDK